jgi:hypothetical protein
MEIEDILLHRLEDGKAYLICFPNMSDRDLDLISNRIEAKCMKHDITIMLSNRYSTIQELPEEYKDKLKA